MTNIKEINFAQERLEGFVRETPILNSPFLDEIAGRKVFIKAECLQHTGSFKFRGGWSAISAMNYDQRKNGVLAVSSGNHAQGVAYAAKAFGVKAVIIMPKDAPALKIENTKRLGAEVILYDRLNQDREALGLRISKERSLTSIKPYDEPLVIAGQGTCGLEIASQSKKLNIIESDVIVCCGGGGLTSGIALALESEAPKLKVRTAEPANFNDVAISLKDGKITRNHALTGSICDAILTPQPGELTFPIMNKLCGPGLTVSDQECLEAMYLAFLRLKLVLEPGGAAALAAALFRTNEIKGDNVIVVATGGNVDTTIFSQAIKNASEHS
jgi:threonine dehydratase